MEDHMKLQLALDHTALGDALRLLDATADMLDIAEVGTPLVLSEGAHAVREIRRLFPALKILADFKVMDAGALEVSIGFEAGADIVTVLGAAETVTIRRACDAARAAGRSVMVDLIGVKNVARRGVEAFGAGAECVCCHAAFDTQDAGGDPLAALEALRAAAPGACIAVAGGITAGRVPALLPYAPQIVIVGGFISRAADPHAAARAFRDALPAS
jgi:3-hexulose-6-phosphate synthase